MQQDNFEKFGSHFQTLLISALINDKAFFEQVYEILKADYFSSEPHKRLMEQINSYFEQYSFSPTFEHLEIFANQLEDETLKKAIYEIVISSRQSVLSDLEYIKDQTLEFCKNQAMKTAILQSVSLLEKNQYGDIHSIIEKAIQSGEKQELGHCYYKDFHKRSVFQQRAVIPTGFSKLDELMDGGHGQGELGVVIAPTGGGKSFVLVNFGYGALQAGKNVLHYTLELSEEAVGLRYDARITGVPIRDIKSYPQMVEKKLKAFNSGRLIIKEYSIKSASVNTFKFHINRLKASGFIPDVIILDYADIMKPKRHYEVKRYELEAIYEDLRALSQELDIPIWTASQSNRQSIDDEVITLGAIAEAYAKEIGRAHV